MRKAVLCLIIAVSLITAIGLFVWRSHSAVTFPIVFRDNGMHLIRRVWLQSCASDGRSAVYIANDRDISLPHDALQYDPRHAYLLEFDQRRIDMLFPIDPSGFSLSAKGDFLLVSSAKGSFRYDMETRTKAWEVVFPHGSFPCEPTIGKDERTVWCAAYTPPTGRADSSVDVIALCSDSGKELYRLSLDACEGGTIQFAVHEAKEMIAINFGCGVYLRRLATGELLRKLHLPPVFSPIWSCHFSANGEMVCVSGGNRWIVCRVTDGSVVASSDIATRILKDDEPIFQRFVDGSDSLLIGSKSTLHFTNKGAATSCSLYYHDLDLGKTFPIASDVEFEGADWSSDGTTFVLTSADRVFVRYYTPGSDQLRETR